MITKHADDCGTPVVDKDVSLPLDREQRLAYYLQKWAGEGIVDRCAAQSAFDIWKCLFPLSHHRLPVPDAADGSKGEVILLWSKDTHYLEIEVAPSDACFVFYKNALTLAHYFYEGKADSLPYTEMLEIISHFV